METQFTAIATKLAGVHGVITQLVAFKGQGNVLMGFGLWIFDITWRLT